MAFVLSRDDMRAFDADASLRLSVSPLVLMENAGRGACEELLRILQAALNGLSPQAEGALWVVCGTGNNGGDGLVLARHLLIRGYSPVVWLVGTEERLTAEAKVQLESFRALSGRVTVKDPLAAARSVETEVLGARVMVDALFGIGLKGDLATPWSELIAALNRRQALKVALDIPSGLDADTGEGAALLCDHTITFAAPKLGMLTTHGAAQVGKLAVTDIGVPAPDGTATRVSARILEASDVRGWVRPRRVSAHKVSVGRVLIFAGSPSKPGAAFLVARGALRAGAGLVTLAGWPETARLFASRVTEEMVEAIDPAELLAGTRRLLERADTVVIGPGLGLEANVRRLLDLVLREFAGRVVLDADALTHFAGRAGELAEASGQLVLTPHPGEMGRLLGIEAKQVERDRFGALARLVEVTRQVVVLKGPRTLIGSQGGVPWVNLTGSPALAAGGSGDVLSGVMGALLNELAPEQAAAAGVYLHGRSGSLWQAEHGADRGLRAREIADGIPGALAELSARKDPLTV